jgi:adenylosuccinate synthase
MSCLFSTSPTIFFWGFFSASLEVQKEIEVEYVTMPGWTEDIANVRKFEDLPEAAQNYVRAVEKYTGLPGELSLVGTFEMRKCDQGI